MNKHMDTLLTKAPDIMTCSVNWSAKYDPTLFDSVEDWGGRIHAAAVDEWASLTYEVSNLDITVRLEVPLAEAQDFEEALAQEYLRAVEREAQG